MAVRTDVRRRPLLGRVSTIALLLALAATALGVWFTDLVVDDQQQRLLEERTGEISLLFNVGMGAVVSDLSAQGGVLRATDGDMSAYTRSATEARSANRRPETQSYAWVRKDGDRFVVAAAVGDGLREGQELTRPTVVQALGRAMTAEKLVSTQVFGEQRVLGFALGPPAAPRGTVLYRESVLGPLRAPQAAGTAPYSELDVALYAAPTVRAGQVLVSTTEDLPLTGTVRTEKFDFGANHWLLAVRPKGSLVGGITSTAPYAVLLVGLVGAVLLAAVVESAARRRDVAVALYESEHRVAETLQRSLLPQLPSVDGLDMSARYLASGSGQMVGGDWFDVFPVHGDRVGIAVGDVIGHDVAAASAMAQIRAALRAYAVDGAEPETVVTRLGRLVDTFGLAQLVTLVYGVLDAPDADGSRLLRFSNAGHLAPLRRCPDGAVESLTGGSSVVIGAPVPVAHTQAQVRLGLGDTVLLFTDGLVEEPGGSLDEALDRLAASVAGSAAENSDQLCDRVLADLAGSELRDDIALLALRVTRPAPVIPHPAQHAPGPATEPAPAQPSDG
jgi:hypothetical protein